MRKVRKYKVYTKLAQKLRRLNFDNPGKLASFLMDSFEESGGYIYAKITEGKGLCDKGKFKIFRESLISTGWILYDEKQALLNKDYSFHRPGPNLIPYLEEERKLQEGVPKTIKELQEKYVSKEISDTIARERDLYKDLCEQYKQQTKG